MNAPVAANVNGIAGNTNPAIGGVAHMANVANLPEHMAEHNYQAAMQVERCHICWLPKPVCHCRDGGRM